MYFIWIGLGYAHAQEYIPYWVESKLEKDDDYAKEALIRVVAYLMFYPLGLLMATGDFLVLAGIIALIYFFWY